MFAEVVTIGDELCRGEIIDTNKAYLAGQLWDRDVVVRWMTSCRDDAEDIAKAIAIAAARADLVICSGGLGPTSDDLTVDVVSELAGVVPVVDPPAQRQLVERFAGRVEVTTAQLRQVRVPQGARVLGNPTGLAPGFEVRLGEIPVVCLPGVPRELTAIFDTALGDRIVELRDARGDAPRIARRIWRCFGRGESQLAQVLDGVVDGVDGATIHYQVKFPEVLVKVVVRDRERAAADARLAAIEQEVRGRIGQYIYGIGEPRLPELVAAALTAGGLTVATAESCTGGLVGELLTSIAGSSAYFRGGVIVYDNREKERLLGVRRETLDGPGAVSEPCVREMAAGARQRFGVDLAVAVSGVAGPGGGTPDKPVGTVWLAVAGAAGVTTKRIFFPSARDQVRLLSAWWALALLRDAAG